MERHSTAKHAPSQYVNLPRPPDNDQQIEPAARSAPLSWVDDVLATTGGFDPSGRHDIVTVPYAGGPPKVLVRDGFLPSWNG